MRFASILARAALLVTAARALNTIDVREQEFIDSGTGKRLVLIGVDYQPGGQSAYGTGQGDPLSDSEACLRDAALMQQLGINTIRVYNVQPGLDHNECVSIFNAVGIYMLIDVNSPLTGQSINRADPGSSYTLSYLQHIFSVVENFKSYPNLLGFFAGNEIINEESNAVDCPPYIRAVQRDLHNYIAKHSSRAIPVGYSAAQVQSVLQDTWAYLQCDISSGVGANSRSDFFGLNSYSWCGNDSSYTISGYNTLVDWFGDSSIPVFFSEYGCNVPSPRYFDEVPTLYGPKMTSLSGGLVYQWTQDSSNFGLVQVNENESAELLFDYYTFSSKLSTVDISLIEAANGTATGIQAPQCNPSLITGSGFNNSFNIPAPPVGAAALISSGVQNPPSGSIVSVTRTEVAVQVTASNGAILTGLKITPGATAANHPGAVPGTATGSAATGKPSNKQQPSEHSSREHSSREHSSATMTTTEMKQKSISAAAQAQGTSSTPSSSPMSTTSFTPTVHSSNTGPATGTSTSKSSASSISVREGGSLAATLLALISFIL